MKDPDVSPETDNGPQTCGQNHREGVSPEKSGMVYTVTTVRRVPGVGHSRGTPQWGSTFLSLSRNEEGYRGRDDSVPSVVRGLHTNELPSEPVTSLLISTTLVSREDDGGVGKVKCKRHTTLMKSGRGDGGGTKVDDKRAFLRTPLTRGRRPRKIGQEVGRRSLLGSVSTGRDTSSKVTEM